VTVAKVISKRIKDWDDIRGGFRPWIPSRYGHASPVHRTGAVPRGPGPSRRRRARDHRPPSYQADYDRAKAGLELAKSQQELAKLEAARVQKLKDSGAVSREELDERLSNLNQQQPAFRRPKPRSTTRPGSFRLPRFALPLMDARAGGSNAVATSSPEETTAVRCYRPLSRSIHLVYFEGDENAYLRYNELARQGQRQSSRDARNPVRVGLANEAGFPA